MMLRRSTMRSSPPAAAAPSPYCSPTTAATSSPAALDTVAATSTPATASRNRSPSAMEVAACRAPFPSARLMASYSTTSATSLACSKASGMVPSGSPAFITACSLLTVAWDSASCLSASSLMASTHLLIAFTASSSTSLWAFSRASAEGLSVMVACSFSSWGSSLNTGGPPIPWTMPVRALAQTSLTSGCDSTSPAWMPGRRLGTWGTSTLG
mmetsp:Transcript_35686/g.101007  ORF Transcript_35686/g.101007 Transcript_35686/m.101007 type:complete len:212 (-) Transcript_35686:1368-2003(-)